jgi:hypothetical protein
MPNTSEAEYKWRACRIRSLGTRNQQLGGRWLVYRMQCAVSALQLYSEIGVVGRREIWTRLGIYVDSLVVKKPCPYE